MSFRESIIAINILQSTSSRMYGAGYWEMRTVYPKWVDSVVHTCLEHAVGHALESLGHTSLEKLTVIH